jgi:hypothetical protein
VGFVMLDSPLVTFREADREEAGLDSAARLEVPGTCVAQWQGQSRLRHNHGVPDA